MADIVKLLKAHARQSAIQAMARFGIVPEKRLGVSIPDIRRIARKAGTDHKLAARLWKTGIPEAMILATMVADPEQLTADEMDAWVRDFNSWDVCDAACMNLFRKSPLARQQIIAWSGRKEEYVKRAAFSLLACLAWHDKHAPDREMMRYLSIIKRAATDDRNFVKKAVNWALRNIGKRNVRLNHAAVKTAHEIHRLDSKSARWIASDALRELQCENVKSRLGR